MEQKNYKKIYKRTKVPQGKYYDARIRALPYNSPKVLTDYGNKITTNMLSKYKMPDIDNLENSMLATNWYQGIQNKYGISKEDSLLLDPNKTYKSSNEVLEEIQKNKNLKTSNLDSIKSFFKDWNKPKTNQRLDEAVATFMGLNTGYSTSEGDIKRPIRPLPPDPYFYPLGPEYNRSDMNIRADGNFYRYEKENLKQESPFPRTLSGIANLNEKDARKMGDMHNQDLLNNRSGKKEGFANHTSKDIYNEDFGNKAKLGAESGWGNRASLATGYGMGWGNAWRASRTDHFKRGLSTINPLSRGNLSIMGEALGRTTTRDMLAFKANPTIMNRLGIMAAPGIAAATIGFGMYNNDSIGEIASTIAIPLLALPSARAGLSIGSALTPAKAKGNLGILRGTGMAVGSIGGFVTGAAAGLALSAGVSDIMSNESKVRSLAGKISKTEFLVPEVNSRQSLTARQMALNKLSKSGLNDRALLLANEAAALKGLI